MKPSAWTGGQYSVYRALFGLYLLIHFLHLLPYGPELFSTAGIYPEASASPLTKAFPNLLAIADSPMMVTGILVLASICSLMFLLGFKDRIAAVILWYIWACLFGRNPLISNPGLPYVGWLLLAHAFLPGKPFGSWDARGRVDPDGGWQMPQALFMLAWALLMVGYTYSGITKLVSLSWVDGTAFRYLLENPLARQTPIRTALLEGPEILLKAATFGALGLEIAAGFLFWFRKMRPWLWVALVALHFGLIILVDFADLTLGMLFIHFFTFDPAWLKAKDIKLRIFYDGECGLCHRTVRFLLAEDRTGLITFSPLQSDAFTTHLSEEQRRDLPDSLVVLTEEGKVLTRSTGILHALKAIGGLWRISAWKMAAIPAPLRDLFYDGVAKVRKKIFPEPKTACPMLPPDLRKRFEV